MCRAYCGHFIGAQQLGNNTSDNELQRKDIIMALDIDNGETMGCAFFDSMEGCLQLADDVPGSDVDVAGQFAAHAYPTSILLSSRARRELIDYSRRSMPIFLDLSLCPSSIVFHMQGGV
jgi:hypothetical protein